MMAIDHFKQINDTYGHQVGDQVLRGIAKEVAGVETAELLRRRLAALEFSADAHKFQITCSMGVSEFRSGDTIDDLLKPADLALYRAKAKGRNRVIGVCSELLPDGAPSGSDIVRSKPR